MDNNWDTEDFRNRKTSYPEEYWITETYKKKKKKKKKPRNRSFSAAMKKKITASNTSPVLVSYWENKTTSARVRDFFHRSTSFNRTKKETNRQGRRSEGGDNCPSHKKPIPLSFLSERTTDPCSVGQRQHNKILREALTKKNANTQDVWR